MPTCPQVSVLEALAEYTSIPVDNTYKTLTVACVLVGIVNVASAGVLYRFDRAFLARTACAFAQWTAACHKGK